MLARDQELKSQDHDEINNTKLQKKTKLTIKCRFELLSA